MVQSKPMLTPTGMGNPPATVVLLIGPGVIGTVYGVQLASAGHHVSVLSHGPRTDEVRRDGFVCQDVNEATPQRCAVVVVSDTAGVYDLVLMAVRADQIRAAMEPLRGPSRSDTGHARCGPRQANASSPPTPATPNTKCAPWPPWSWTGFTMSPT